VAAKLGRLTEALQLASKLTSSDSAPAERLGFVGVVAARLGDRMRARAILEQLAADGRPYTVGEPQFYAGRIATALGDLEQAASLLALAQSRGYPYDIEFHRDPAFLPLRGSRIFQQMEARRDRVSP
jgi:hypothetical protein